MKRLTPEQVTNGYAKGWGAPNAQSLRKDHLQAREDVELLAKALKDHMGDCRCRLCARSRGLLSRLGLLNGLSP